MTGIYNRGEAFSERYKPSLYVLLRLIPQANPQPPPLTLPPAAEDIGVTRRSSAKTAKLLDSSHTGSATRLSYDTTAHFVSRPISQTDDDTIQEFDMCDRASCK